MVSPPCRAHTAEVLQKCDALVQQASRQRWLTPGAWYDQAMASIQQTTTPAATLPGVVLRLGLMAGAVAALIVVSTPLRTLEPLSLRIATNILVFIAAGVLDELLLAPVLNRWPLVRAAVLVVETLALGWFFSPGAVRPASKFLFYTHLAPFFVAVFGGALAARGVKTIREGRVPASAGADARHAK